MPYVPDLGFVLSDAQEALRQNLVDEAKILQHLYGEVPPTKRPLDGYLMGELVQPAHTIEAGTLPIPERRFLVYYQPNYGVVSPRLCTSNGKAWAIASCVCDDTRWEPATEEKTP